MKLKQVLPVFILFFVLGISSFILKDEDPVEKIVSSLQRWSESMPQEKLYLHIDKPYYALGDTIWFKAYITVGSRHHLSALSEALYADLVNDKDSVIKTIKLPVGAGMAMGDFTLEEDLTEGNYRIRAYTQWMRNAGEDYFFDRTLTVGDPLNNEVVAKINYKYKTVNNKAALTALVNYKDEAGKPVSDREVSYSVMANHKVIGTEKVTTDANGNISINILNDQRSNMEAAQILTTIKPDGKKKITKTFPIKAALSQSDVQFFPESGNLVIGVSSRIAFKAVGIDGLGLAVKGTIVDDVNAKITDFATQHAGMGTFNLKPADGKNYKARITFQDGSESTLDLPKAAANGYVLSIYQPNKDSLLLRINASAGQYLTPQSVRLIAQTGGETIYASQIKITSGTTLVWMSKNNFPSGIAQFTLFSNRGEPLNERIAFIKNPDQMELKLSTARQSYKPRERVEIELESKGPDGKPVAGNFSVTVIDESKVPVDENTENTILSSILLTSDLKGYIEKPGYYFAGETEEISKALDNLMLTQGYRRFTWKEVLSSIPPQPVYKPEKLVTEISGKLVSLTNKPVSYGKVTLLSLKGGVLADTVTDAYGRFKFDNMVVVDSLKFAVQGRTAKNGKKVEIILDKVLPPPLTKNRNIADINVNIESSLKEYLDNSRKQDESLMKLGGQSRIQRLKEVKILAKKKEDEKYTKQGMFKIPAGHADQTFMLNKAENCASLWSCLQGRLQGVFFYPKLVSPGIIINWPSTSDGGGRPSFMQIMVDGRRLDNAFDVADVFENNVIDPMDIAKIDVVRANRALMAFLGGPAILIVTKSGYWRSFRYNPSMANITPKGFNNSREFYSPRYDNPNVNAALADLRTTIYWNPAVKTKEDGNTTFDFFNAGEQGNYKVIIEGINVAGELGRQVYRYTVM